MNIKLMDIKRQFDSYKEEYEQAILDVARSGNYIGGEDIEQFEQEFATYMGSKFAVSCGNGTDALVIALRALDIGSGDEVITTAFTFFATGESIARVGAIPVFVDIDKTNYCMDVTLIEEKITNRTKAIMPVHLYGNCADMHEIKRLANKYNLKVIADCAQATGTRYNGSNKGILGDVSCFSFFPTKNLGGIGDGGMIVTDNERIMYICKSFRTHGCGIGGKIYCGVDYEALADENETTNKIETEKYYNYFIGYNSRLDTIQAAVLRKKLKHIEEFIAARRRIAKYYYDNINKNIYILPNETLGCRHSYYVYVLQHRDSNRVMRILRENGIESRVYYPVPLHLQKAFDYLNYRSGMLPVTERLCRTTFAVPIYPEMKDYEEKYVVDILNNKVK